MKYLITAMGRSGTASIARFLGCPHEIDNELVENSAGLRRVRERFQEAPDGYMECSSYLRKVAPFVGQDIQRVYVTRHPYDIARSGKARGYTVEEVAEGIQQLYRSISIEVLTPPVFKLEHIIEDTGSFAHVVGLNLSGELPRLNATNEHKLRISLSEAEKDLLRPFLKVPKPYQAYEEK